ncbi:MAG TPA: flavin reductase family protein [Ktedonobacteraceae bacterium]|nr:flavin reductase family protein [Ktedonobacteraceae bacterium]
MAIEKDFFRQVMGRFATGVTIVTTQGSQGPAGLTVNTFCSVSLNPPLVLVCIDMRSHTLQYIRDSGAFAVNILTVQQEKLSRCFATPSQERYEQFCNADYHLAATGSPIIDDVLAFVDVRVVAEYPGGDHAIFLGEVVAMGTSGQIAYAQEEDAQEFTISDDGDDTVTTNRPPLAYYRGQYRHLTGDYRKPSLASYYDEDFD